MNIVFLPLARTFAAALLLVLIVPVAGTTLARAPQSSELLTIRYLLDRGDYVQAESSATRALAAAKAASPADPIAIAATQRLYAESRWRNGRTADGQALILAKAALDGTVARVGADTPEAAACLRTLGDVQLSDGAYDAAVESYSRALAILERFPAESAEIPQILAPLATALFWADRWPDAVATAERAVALSEAAAADPVRLGRALVAQAEILRFNDETKLAHDAIERGMKALDSGDAAAPERAYAMQLFGEQLLVESQSASAHDYFVKAFELASSSLRPGHPDLARYMTRLAKSTSEQGDGRQANALREQAAAIASAGLRPDHLQLGRTINDHALGLLEDEDYAGALTEFERALAIFEKRGPLAATTTAAHYNLSITLTEMGDLRAARQHIERALANWGQTRGRESSYAAFGFLGLAKVLAAEGKNAEAISALQKAVDIRRKLFGDNSTELAMSLTRLSRAQLIEGQAGRALADARESAAIFERAQLLASPGYADAMSARAEAEERQGELASAQASYRTAIATLERVHGPAHPEVSYAKTSLALALRASSEYAEALRTVLDAETIERDHAQAVVRYLPERQAINLLAINAGNLDIAMSLLEGSPRSTAIVFDRVIRARSIVLDEMAKRHRLDAEAPSDVRSMRAELIAMRQRLANLLVRGPGIDGLDAYFQKTGDLRDHSERIERALADKSAAFRAEQQIRNTGLVEVQRALPDGSVLVAIHRYDRLQPLVPGGARAASAIDVRASATPWYVAFVLRSDSLDPTLIPLGDAATTDELVRRWRAAIMAGPAGAAAGTEQRVRELGTALRRRVWDPIAAQLAGANRVFVVPDGSLNLLTFGALPVGTAKYLLETGPTLHYLSSERDLVRADGDLAAPPARGLVAFGNPSFDGSTLRAATTQTSTHQSSFRSTTSTCPGFQTMTFSGLPSSGSEARDIAALWSEFAPLGTAPIVLTGNEADEQSVKGLAPGSRVLHLATHGFFLSGECAPQASSTRSVGGLTPRKPPASAKKGAPQKVQTVQPEPVRARASIENPLLLTGLALAGANQRASAGLDDEDGILTAEEVASMNLAGVEWAVLSACDTGLGEIRAGEGVFGLRRAFQIAGAHTVIMSLWGVGDRSASAWMRALYEGRLARKLDTAAAVREASITVLRQRRAKGQSTHPFYWAGFVASGDWR